MDDLGELQWIIRWFWELICDILQGKKYTKLCKIIKKNQNYSKKFKIKKILIKKHIKCQIANRISKIC